MADSKKLQIQIVEQFIQSKTGDLADCEDRIHVSDNFLAVIDGATSKTDKRWSGHTGGQIAADLINKTLAEIDPGITIFDAAKQLTAKIRQFYQEHDALDFIEADPKERFSASAVILSLKRNEIWSIGDCQYMIGDQLYSITKEVDRITSEARSLYLTLQIAAGKNIEALREADAGRQFILPLLEKQAYFQNNPAAGEYWYPALDGFPVPKEGIVRISLPDKIDTIILASDGYPFLKDSLADSEAELDQLLREDPLLMRELKSTKGLSNGNVSYDDRAYLKIRIRRED